MLLFVSLEYDRPYSFNYLLIGKWESKEKLINDKIAIENLIKNPVQDTDVAKLEKDKEEINKKIEELNQQYVPVIKDKDRLLKEKSNLHILKNSFY